MEIMNCGYKNENEHSCVNCNKRFLSLFEGLSEKELELLDKNRITARFKKGETIYKENTRPSGLYCLSEGKAKIVKLSHKKQEVIVALKRPVDFLNLEALIIGKNYVHSAIALEDVSVCIVDEKHFNEVLMKNILFARKLLESFIYSLWECQDHFINITQKQIHARVANTLLQLQEFYGCSSDGFIDIALKRQDIASLSGMTSANVIRTISTFEKENIIACDKKRIKILNKHHLIDISKNN